MLWHIEHPDFELILDDESGNCGFLGTPPAGFDIDITPGHVEFIPKESRSN